MPRNILLTVPCIVMSVFIFMNQAAANTGSLTRQELQAMLSERDATITRLQQTVAMVLDRLANLEKAVNIGTTRSASQPSRKTRSPDPYTLQAQPEEQAPEPEANDPTKVKADESEAERALERTLVQEGALLLPLGVVEIEPSFTYSFNETEFPAIVMGFLGTNNVESSSFQAGLDVRVGLPFESQFEFSLPYSWRRIDTVGRIGGAAVSDSHRNGDGIGDVTLGFAKTLIREKGLVPDIVARAQWNTGSGDRADNGVQLGGSFASVTGSLNFVKRSDPLAFFGSVGYRTFYEDGNVDPGDQLRTLIGVALAASPESSLFMSLDSQFASEFEVGGVHIDGSDQTLATLNLGVSTILGQGVLLNITGGIGVTDAATDYSLGISIPVRTSVLADKIFRR